MRAIESAYLDETDLAGPLVFALVFGTCLLLAGKLHFGYIYGFGVFGCLALNAVLNLMCDDARDIDAWRTASVLGYCLLPVVLLSAAGIVLDLRGALGLGLAVAAVMWSCTAATKVSGRDAVCCQGLNFSKSAVDVEVEHLCCRRRRLWNGQRNGNMNAYAEVSRSVCSVCSVCSEWHPLIMSAVTQRFLGEQVRGLLIHLCCSTVHLCWSNVYLGQHASSATAAHNDRVRCEA
jgi:hypothetical protein